MPRNSTFSGAGTRAVHNDSFGLGIYHNVISQPSKNDFKQLTGGAATVKNENGLEVFYEFAITPALGLIPSYQHIWISWPLGWRTMSTTPTYFFFARSLTG
jgi:hypothetical protein